MNSKLLMGLREALDLSVEIGAVLLDEDLRDFSIRVQQEQQKVLLERQALLDRLEQPEVWADKVERAKILRSLDRAVERSDKLEDLEDQIQQELFRRAEHGREIQVTQAGVLEVTRKVAISYSSNNAA